jgi:hypothetical protein
MDMNQLRSLSPAQLQTLADRKHEFSNSWNAYLAKDVGFIAFTY